jgi:uncharacterized repeat protein (TIGR01451 family)
MIKKIIALGVMLIMCLGLFYGCTNDYTYKVEDFRLTITVDKTEVSVGDTIKFVATFKNLSGQDIRIENFSNTLDGILFFSIFNDPTPVIAVPHGPKAKRKKFVLQKDTIITKTMEFYVDGQLMEIEAVASVSFYIGKSYINTFISSELIKILVKE